MSPADEDILNTLASPTDDVDRDLLLLLARFEASVRWDDMGQNPLDAPRRHHRNHNHGLRLGLRRRLGA